MLAYLGQGRILVGRQHSIWKHQLTNNELFVVAFTRVPALIAARWSATLSIACAGNSRTGSGELWLNRTASLHDDPAQGNMRRYGCTTMQPENVTNILISPALEAIRAGSPDRGLQNRAMQSILTAWADAKTCQVRYAIDRIFTFFDTAVSPNNHATILTPTLSTKAKRSMHASNN